MAGIVAWRHWQQLPGRLEILGDLAVGRQKRQWGPLTTFEMLGVEAVSRCGYLDKVRFFQQKAAWEGQTVIKE